MSKQTWTNEQTYHLLMLLGLFILSVFPFPALCYFMPYHWLTITVGVINFLGATTALHIDDNPHYNEHGHRVITGNEISWQWQIFGWGSIIGLIASIAIAWKF